MQASCLFMICGRTLATTFQKSWLQREMLCILTAGLCPTESATRLRKVKKKQQGKGKKQGNCIWAEW